VTTLRPEEHAQTEVGESAPHEGGGPAAPEPPQQAASDAILSLERVDLDRVDWKDLDSYPDRNVHQTREWLEFLESTQHAEPVVAAIKQDGETVGFFTGAVVRRYGVRILGSPFRGWTTAYMGFNLRESVSRRAAVEALAPFAFGPLRCMHIELRDRLLGTDDLDGLAFACNPKTIFEVDLRRPEDEIFNSFTSACRRCIRKAEKVGVRIEEAEDFDFAHEYHAQLKDVFEKQSLVPMYGPDRVTALIRHLQPTGRLLLLRARDDQGECIATGIFPAMNKAMYFWGGASWRQYQILRPNEALLWHAMRYWKSRGIEAFDLGGGAEYKRKYAGNEVPVPYFMLSRFRALTAVRALAKRGVKLQQAARGRLKTIRNTS
jgi:CelD/BcsL family acetyltransferase involved in cellulose biosynthesis